MQRIKVFSVVITLSKYETLGFRTDVTISYLKMTLGIVQTCNEFQCITSNIFEDCLKDK